jgi:hypothetical protein
MRVDHVHTRLRVRVKALRRPVGILAAPEYLANRQEGTAGTVGHAVKDHENAWWVYDPHGKYAPYWHSEMEPLPAHDQLGIFGDVFPSKA